MGDVAPTGTRERVWIDKLDHATDPPTVVERIFIENGAVVAIRRQDADGREPAEINAEEEQDGRQQESREDVREP